MAAQLGGQQISALLESLPGIASVLRSPVADAMVAMIRAGAGVGDFRESDANELVQYAVRRGLLGSDEGEELLAEVRAATKGRGRRTKARKTAKATTKTAKKPAAKVAKKAAPWARARKKATTKKVPKKSAAKKTKTAEVAKKTKAVKKKTAKRTR